MASQELLVELKNAIPNISDGWLENEINWSISKNEIWTVFGKNGSGKSLLADVLSGKQNLRKGEIIYSEKIKNKNIQPKEAIHLVRFDEVYSLADYGKQYYQQRYDNVESDVSPFVNKLFSVEELQSDIILNINKILPFDNLLPKRLNQLSSGELRKILIVRSLKTNPGILIFDNPFIGLDKASRNHLNEIFHLLNQQGIQLIFLVPALKDIPECTTHVLHLDKCQVTKNATYTEFINSYSENNLTPTEINWSELNFLPPKEFENVVTMNNIKVNYGENVILENVNWNIKRGENWALLGPNGSGKSTLLSYIFADNPHAYGQQLSLFDFKRGTGESIWDIKKRIGFTSSEMHLFYRERGNCVSVVASGVLDNIGLSSNSTLLQMKAAEDLLRTLQLDHISKISFHKVSAGQQRMLLFARAIIKNPDLLILDEPFHGLDTESKQLCSSIVESFCKQPNKSLIYITHRYEEIPSCVTHVFELKNKTGIEKLIGEN